MKLLSPVFVLKYSGRSLYAVTNSFIEFEKPIFSTDHLKEEFEMPFGKRSLNSLKVNELEEM